MSTVVAEHPRARNVSWFIALLAWVVGSWGVVRPQRTSAQAIAGRLLVTEYSGGSVVDAIEGGNLSMKARFATGLSGPLGLCIGPNNHVYVAELNSSEVTDITAGGSFTSVSAFATGVTGPSVLACSSTKIYVAEYSSGRVLDITAGGNFASAPPFATVPTSMTGPTYLSSLVFDSQGRLWAAASTGVWEITAGGTFTTSNRFATLPSTQANDAPSGFGELNGTLYLGLYYGKKVIPVTAGDLTSAQSFVTSTSYLSGFSSSAGRAFATTYVSGGNGSSVIYDMTNGGAADGTGFATGLGASYFGGILYYNACGDGVVQSTAGEDCDDGAQNNDTTPDACRTSCHDASCGDGVVDTGETCDDGAQNSDTTAGACRTSCEAASCGDGVVDAGEDCDGGSNCPPGCMFCTDSDSDGTCDVDDECPNDAPKTEPGQCGCTMPDTDTDGDATANCNDGCPNDMTKTAAGVCGCGMPDTDSDGDATANCNDGCPDDMLKTAAGACGCGMPDTDSDGDGTANCNDGCPNDMLKTTGGVCGCGTPDTDTDGDSVLDCDDACLGDDTSGDDDSDGVCNDRDHQIIVGASFAGEEGPCDEGGVRIAFGTDADASGTLTGAEIEQTQYACNGTKGTNGDDGKAGAAGKNGLTSRARSSKIAANSQECRYGGLKLETGADSNSDGELSDAEVTSTTIVCNASGVIVRTTALAVSSERCPAGGVLVETGLDQNSDGELNDAEVQNSESLCQNARVLVETTSLAESTDACPHGGVRIDVGEDDGTPAGTAGDGKLQADEVDSTKNVCLAETDVLVNGGGSSCSVNGPGRTDRNGFSFVVLAVGLTLMVRRRRRRGSN